nr:reverse transcriptase domain-containing protein [Tanacetum cinerariifolium]
MSTNEQTPLIQPTSVVRNTLGKGQVPQNLGGSISDEALREYCDKNYHQILPIIAEKVHQEKVQQEKLKAQPGSPEPRRDSSKSLKERGPQRKTVFKKILAVVEEEGHTWMIPIYEYLTKEILLEEKWKARVIRRKAGSMHAGPRFVVENVLRSGYYWPTMHSDAWNLIRECSSCEGIDRAGPFLEGPGKVKFLIVAMDYFTKWIEAKPVAIITGDQEAKSKAKMEKYYNARVRSTSFRPEDLIYQSNEASRSEDGGKLGPKWEGPYEITKALGKGAYKHRDRNGNTLPWTWNVCILKKCYVHEM